MTVPVRVTGTSSVAFLTRPAVCERARIIPPPPHRCPPSSVPPSPTTQLLYYPLASRLRRRRWTRHRREGEEGGFIPRDSRSQPRRWWRDWRRRAPPLSALSWWGETAPRVLKPRRFCGGSISDGRTVGYVDVYRDDIRRTSISRMSRQGILFSSTNDLVHNGLDVSSIYDSRTGVDVTDRALPRQSATNFHRSKVSDSRVFLTISWCLLAPSVYELPFLCPVKSRTKLYATESVLVVQVDGLNIRDHRSQ